MPVIRSKAFNVAPSWPGFSRLRYLFVFGDSYSDVGYHLQKAHPSDKEPLGIEYPGITHAEEGKPNWVGYLAKRYNKSPLLIFDYAVAGDTVAGVVAQVERRFFPVEGPKPAWARWTAENSLFITWVGINDIGRSSHYEPAMQKLFAAQELHYEVGARNFVFVDVPPIHRTPALRANDHDIQSHDGSFPYQQWNNLLTANVETFAASHPDASVFLFSSWDSFNRALDNPTGHGLEPSDVAKPFGKVWVDYLHPGTALHRVIAKDLTRFLEGVRPHPTTSQSTSVPSTPIVDSRPPTKGAVGGSSSKPHDRFQCRIQ